MLMQGNLLRESGVVERLNKAAQNEIANVATLFLGITIGSTMSAGTFLNLATIQILILGLFAFALDTVAGLLFGKFMAFVTRGVINPLIGAAGISAFPMAGRIAAQVAQDEDFENFILMHAMGANTGGQLGSVMVGGLLLALVVGILYLPKNSRLIGQPIYPEVGEDKSHIDAPQNPSYTNRCILVSGVTLAGKSITNYRSIDQR